MAIKAKDIYLDTWKWDGILMVGGTHKDFRAFAKHVVDEDMETSPFAAGHAVIKSGKPWVIWLSDLYNAPCLAHEALHVACAVLASRGLVYSVESEEAFTYTMESIMSQALLGRGWKPVRFAKKKKAHGRS